MVGKISSDLNYISNIAEILNNGFKFIPCIHINKSELFNSLLQDIDNMILNFNNSYIRNNLLNKNDHKEYKYKNIPTNINISFEECNTLNCILSEINKRKRKTNASFNSKYQKLNNDVNEFRFSLLDMIKTHTFKIKPNLNREQINLIRDHRKSQPFMIVELDKNIGAGLINKDLHDSLVYFHLNDTNTYVKLNDNPLIGTVDHINEILDHLFARKSISKRVYNALKPLNSKLSSFRILLKVHKPKFDTRAIVNCKNSPTSSLSLFIELILRRFVESSPSYVKDSSDLIKQCYDLSIPSDAVLYSCDFSALYTNIPSEKCLNLIMSFLKKQANFINKDFDLFAVYYILRLTLYNNVFEFNGSFYKQIKGISMGTICGPTIANLYLSILETNLLCIERPIIYKRYIDDIFMIINRLISNAFFEKYFPGLKVTINTGNVVVFLDLLISIAPDINRLFFNLYIKPICTPAYVNMISNHPYHIKKNIPKGLFIRIRRICSSFIDYVYHCNKLIDILLTKGYDLKYLRKLSNIIAGINRESLLSNKRKISFPFGDSILCKYVYNDSHNGLSQKFNKVWSNINPNSAVKVVNKVDLNLKSLFVFNARLSNQYLKTKINRHCKNLDCKTCNLFFKCRYQLNDHFTMPIYHDCSCDSSGIIYVLSCTQCRYHYIGESSRLASIRLQEHVYNINYHYKFKVFKGVVSQHFNDGLHDLNELYKILRFSILKKDLIDTNKRRHMESDLINIFNKFKIKTMNDMSNTIPNRYIKHLFFN